MQTNVWDVTNKMQKSLQHDGSIVVSVNLSQDF